MGPERGSGASSRFPDPLSAPTLLLPHTFNLTNVSKMVERGFRTPCTLSNAKEQPRIEFDYVNYGLPGVYNVSYDVFDDYENKAVQVSRTVTVKDTTPPVLQLIGGPIMYVRYNETFEDPGANATDTGDDYYYNVLAHHTSNMSACNYSRCTDETPNTTLSHKIVRRVHHERLECRRVPVLGTRPTPPLLCQHVSKNEALSLACPNGTHIGSIPFASWGTPTGTHSG